MKEGGIEAKLEEERHAVKSRIKINNREGRKSRSKYKEREGRKVYIQSGRVAEEPHKRKKRG